MGTKPNTLLSLFLVSNLAFFNAAMAETNGQDTAKTAGVLTVILDMLTSSSSETPPALAPLSINIYVAGESVEKQNHFDHMPFNTDGTLNDRGDQNNTIDEFGWMVPFSERLKLRDPKLAIKWVGSECWTDHNWECSNGVYTNDTIGHTSAISGSTIASWLSDHQDELTNKKYCYDVAFASRGGNDLNNGVSRDAYKQQLRSLVMQLDQGSNCRQHPVIYISAHLLDVAGWGYGYFQDSIDEWMAIQQSYYVGVAQELAQELDGQNNMHVRFIDMWTPFRENRSTTAFPSPNWWTIYPDTGVSVPDLAMIHHDGEQHPRRLASIFAGENVANQIDITEIRQLLGQ